MQFTFQLKSEIPEYQANLRLAVAEGAKQSALLVQSVAQRLVRVETGSLRDTIDIEKVLDTGDEVQWSVNAGDTSGGYRGSESRHEGSPVDYAIEQEYGTGNGTYTPYMTPAAEVAAVEVAGQMADLIGQVHP